jgi:hypothetical protein
MIGSYDIKLNGGEGGRQLSVTLPSGRKVMDYQNEMIANNDVFGLLQFRYMTADGKPRFHYDTNGLVTLGEYIGINGQSIRLMAETLMEISVAIGGLEKFLLEEKCLLLEIDLIFIDPVRKGVKLAYLPAEQPEDRRTSFIDLVMDLVGSYRPEDATGKLFCRRIIEEVKKAGFRYEAFTDFLLDILCFSEEKINDGSDDYWKSIGAKAGRQGATPAGSTRTGSTPAGATRTGATPAGVSPVGASPGSYKNGAPFGGIVDKIKKRIGFDGSGVMSRGATPAGAAPAGATPAADAVSVKDGRLLYSALAAAAVAVVYFGIISIIPQNIADGSTYRSAALLAAVGAELLLLKYFISKPPATAAAGAGKSARKNEITGAVQAAAAIYSSNAHSLEPPGMRDMADLWAESAAEGDTAQPVGGVDTPDINIASPATDELYDLLFDAEFENQYSETAKTPDAPDASSGITYDSHSAVLYVEANTDIFDNIKQPDGYWDFERLDARNDYCRSQTAEYPVAEYPVQEPDNGISSVESPENYPMTEMLPFLRRIEATLLIRDVMREYGVTLTKNEFSIGRMIETSDLALDNPAVGKTHAKLIKEGDRWYLYDLHSRNGTYLNNIKLESGGKKPLYSSDMITVANVDMIFSPVR